MKHGTKESLAALEKAITFDHSALMFCVDSMLSLLVMDLGYSNERPPRIARHPIRHQLAWGAIQAQLGKDVMQKTINDMILQRDKENL